VNQATLIDGEAGPRCCQARRKNCVAHNYRHLPIHELAVAPEPEETDELFPFPPPCLLDEE
jgi:hypothetical protein